jgi:hypothetical protein
VSHISLGKVHFCFYNSRRSVEYEVKNYFGVSFL